jgi:glycosyltransferase involved in cell wall biosynthesis
VSGTDAAPDPSRDPLGGGAAPDARGPVGTGDPWARPPDPGIRGMAPVSVIVPAYNAARYLAEALESVLRQTWPPLEVIVVDDGSTDGSDEVAARYGPRVAVHRQPHRGVGAARNLGARLAAAPLLAFLDADDVWALDKLDRQCALLRSRPELACVFGQARQFLSPDLEPAARARIQGDGTVRPAPLPSAMLIRREAFFAVGPFAEALTLGEPLEWYVRAVDAGLPMAMPPAIVVHRRLHPDSQGFAKREARVEYARILAARLRRRGGRP